MKSSVAVFLAALSLLLSFTPASALKETEPNTLPEQANVIRVGEAVMGIFEDSFDHFRVSLPSTGKVTVTVSGCPAGGNVQLGVKDFGYTGWEESNGRGQVSLTFNATSPNGLIWLKPTFHGSSCGKDWCIARFVPNGPYNVTKRSPSLPGTYEGVAIHPEVNYQLTVVAEPAAPVGTTGPATPGGGGTTPGKRPEPPPQPTGGTVVPTGPTAGKRPETPPPTAGNPVPTGTTPSGGAKLFRDNNFGFSFELPAAMSSQLLPDKGGYLISGPPGSDLNEVAIVVQVVSKSANPGSSPGKQLKQARQQIKAQPGGEIDSEDDRRVAGRKVDYFVGSYRAGDSRKQQTKWKHMQTVLESGGNYYWVSYAAPVKVFKENKDIFMHMLDTFAFR